MDIHSTVESRLLEERDALERRLQAIDHQLFAQGLKDEMLCCEGRAGLSHDWQTVNFEQTIDRPSDYYYLGGMRYPYSRGRTYTSEKIKCRCVRCPATMEIERGSRY